VHIEGGISGQLAIGENILQIGDVHGGVVNVAMPEQKPQPKPRPSPVLLRPRPFPGLLDQETEIGAATATFQSALRQTRDAAPPVEFYGQAGVGKTAIAEGLAHLISAGHVHLLTGEQATRTAILSALDALSHLPVSQPTVIVYFSGHGYQVASPTSEFYYLLPHGYDVNLLYQTCISGAEFADRLRAIPARKLVLLLDCCHAGGVGEAKAPGLQMAKSPLPTEAQGLLAEGSGRVIVASSREDELSYAGRPYSAFTLALIESLCGAGVSKQDGYVRVADLALHARQMVPGRTKDRQHPVLHFEQADNFVLAYYAGGEAQPKGLPFTGEPEIEPQPGAWTIIEQRGQVAVGGEGPLIQFGNVSGGQVTIGEKATNRTPEATCRSCGYRLRAGARFCNKCGDQVKPK